MNAQTLIDTARALVAGDKGLLAMDEIDFRSPTGRPIAAQEITRIQRWRVSEKVNCL